MATLRQNWQSRRGRSTAGGCCDRELRTGEGGRVGGREGGEGKHTHERERNKGIGISM